MYLVALNISHKQKALVEFLYHFPTFPQRKKAEMDPGNQERDVSGLH